MINFAKERQMKIQTVLAALSFIALIGASHAAENATIWVGPQSAITSPGAPKGSLENPYQDIVAAIDSAGGLLNKQDVEVRLIDGKYIITQPLTLNNLTDHRLSILANNKQMATIDGGVYFNLKSADKISTNKVDIYRVQLSPYQDIRQISIQGLVGQRARYKVWDYDFQSRRNEGGFRMPNLDMAPMNNLPDTTEVEVNTLLGWQHVKCSLAAIEAGNYFRMASSCVGAYNEKISHYYEDDRSGRSGPRATWFENALSFLDEPGEWYYDRRTGYLYVAPYNPSELDQTGKFDIAILNINHLVEIAGYPGQRKKNITLKGINFVNSRWVPEYNEQGYMPGQATWHNVKTPEGNVITNPIDAAIYVRYATGIQIEDNTFRAMGGSGIRVAEGTDTIGVSGNLLENIGGIGIIVGNVWGEAGAPTEGIWVTRNQIRNVGQQYLDSTAIFVGYARYNNISDNKLVGGPYSGMSIGWGWSTQFSDFLHHNTISNNYVAQFNSVLIDGGGIYTLNRQDGTLISNNFIEKIYGGMRRSNGSSIHPYATIYGIYLDEGSSFMEIGRNKGRAINGALIGPTSNTQNPNYRQNIHDNTIVPDDGTYPPGSPAPPGTETQPTPQPNPQPNPSPQPVPSPEKPWYCDPQKWPKKMSKNARKELRRLYQENCVK